MMIIYIVLVISLAAKCSSMPPTYPNRTKPVQINSSHKFRGKGHQPSVKLKSEPMSTANVCPNPADLDEKDPFSNDAVQFAPLPFKLKDKKTIRLCTKDSTSKPRVAFEYEGGEEVEGSIELPPKKSELEPYVAQRGHKVYNQFIPGHYIRAYKANKDVAGSRLVVENDKLENIFRQYLNFKNEWKSKHVPKLAIFNVASSYTTDDELFEMDIAEKTSQAPTAQPATRPKLRLVHMNIMSNRISHVAPAAGLVRMVAHPVGNFKLGNKELSRLRNKYFDPI